MTKEQLECAFEGIGRQVGDLVRCLVQQEIAAKTQQIEQLQAMTTGTGATAITVVSAA